MKVRSVKEWDVPDLSERLRRAARESKKSVVQLCKDAGISTAFWYGMTGGSTSSVALPTLSAIQKALGVDLGLSSVLPFDDLPSVAIECRSSLPNESCVYFAIDEGGVVQYVGASVDVKKRWASHHKLKELREMPGVRISYIVMDASLLDSVESAMIQLLRPPLNNVAGWPKGKPRGDGTVEERIRPTEISASLYGDVVERAAHLDITTRAAMEQALNAWLVVTEEEAEEEASENP